jgi:hypothetical protein
VPANTAIEVWVDHAARDVRSRPGHGSHGNRTGQRGAAEQSTPGFIVDGLLAVAVLIGLVAHA